MKINENQLYCECKICRSPQLRHHWRVKDYKIARCMDCGFKFVQNKITEAELLDYYSNLYPEFDNETNSANLSFYYLALKDLIEQKSSPGRICDVGCARGFFLELMEGWDCYGTEISSATASIAKTKFTKNHILACELAYADWPDEFFDVITMQDSFDHMRDPMGALNACNRLLRTGGLLVVKVHDIESFFARLTRKWYYGVVPPSHLSYFSQRSLKSALDRNGFGVDAIHYLPHALYVSTIFERLSFQKRSGIFHALGSVLTGTAIGNIRFQKNLYDIMTVFATKHVVARCGDLL